jgi:hypothetical protein
MNLNMIFCSYLELIKWLQNNLLTCPFKKLTGIDCPGCGFQSSVIALLQGDLQKSIYLYPAAFPIILIVLFRLAQIRYPDSKTARFKKPLYIFTGCIITVSYVFKMSCYI